MNDMELATMERYLRGVVRRYKKQGIPTSSVAWGASSPEIAEEMRRRIPELPPPLDRVVGEMVD